MEGTALLVCHQCQHELTVKDRVGRRDTCPHCGADLRCCLNCAFYDTRYADACREPNIEPVRDKDRGNFCEFFTVREQQKRQPETSTIDVRAQLEALFKKKS
jgi:hypothetical protein